jgi:hypothetical protein
LLDEVDAISAVSGGSFTAAYYGLHGDATFPAFEQQVLRRDLNGDLLRRVLNPMRWFTPEGRSAAAAQLYGRTIFQGARFADLQKRDGPLVVINASDLESGNRFAFLQGQFNLLCSDLLSYPVGDAVAASSAVPVLFELFSMRGGHIEIRKQRKGAPGFSHKITFCSVHQPAGRHNDGFYVLHLMMEFKRDHQCLRMTTKNDDHIRQWAQELGAEPDYKLRDDFRRCRRREGGVLPWPYIVS